MSDDGEFRWFWVIMAVFWAPFVMLGTWTGITTEDSIFTWVAIPEFFAGMWSRGVGLFRGEGTIPFLLIWALIISVAIVVTFVQKVRGD